MLLLHFLYYICLVYFSQLIHPDNHERVRPLLLQPQQPSHQVLPLSLSIPTTLELVFLGTPRQVPPLVQIG